MATTSVSSTSTATATATKTTAEQIAAANKASAQKLLSSMGAGSGVDTASLAQNLVDAEKLPRQNAINAKITKNESKISGLSAVMFMMSELKTNLSGLKAKSSYNSLNVGNSNTAAVTVTASNSAVAGTYSVAVNSLANPQRSISTGFAAARTLITPTDGSATLALTLNSENVGVSVGIPSTTGSASASVINPSFGTSPSVQDFKQFSLTINGKTLNVRPTPATADLSALAADLQAKLQELDGTDQLSVNNVGGMLTVTSSDTSREITDISLSNSTTISLDPGGIAGVSDGSSITGIAFGTVPSVNDFASFSLSIGGTTRTVIPAPTGPTLAALATDLQARLRVLDGSDDLSVQLNGTSLTVVSASGKTIADASLTKQVYENTPEGVIAAINNSGAGVQADMVNDGSSGTPYKIMVTGASGSTESFALTSNAADLSFGYGATGGNAASDAQVKINGIAYTRKSNSLGDVIKGATLNLQSLTSSAANIVLSRDTTAIKEKMAAFVVAYNDLDNIVKETTNAKSELETYGATLVGDSAVRSIRQQMRNILFGQSSSPGASIKNLGQLGFKTDQSGVLSLDDTTLAGVLQNNFDDVVKMMTGNQENVSTLNTQAGGLAGDAVRSLTKLLDKTGALQNQSTNAGTQNTKYKDDLAKLETRMASLLTRYAKQFSVMNSLVGAINTQKSSLKSTFDGMMSMYTSK